MPESDCLPTDAPQEMRTLAGDRPPFSPGMVVRWLRAGVQTALLRSPRWDGLHVHPAVIVALLALGVLVAVVTERLWIDGPARFNPFTLLSGWLSTAAAAWICYALRPREHGPASAARTPGAAHLFSLLAAQICFFTLLFYLLGTAVTQYSAKDPALAQAVWWWSWVALWVWLCLAHVLALARATGRNAWAVPAAVLIVALGVLESYHDSEPLWVAERRGDSSGEQAREWLKLTQARMEHQPQLLAQRLQALQPQRPGTIDLYALTFAPFAHEDVFQRESAMVAEVMQERFDAAGRTLQLVNHLDTLDRWPWATQLNLERAIHHVAQLMDRDEDILFLHLTSHGAQDGELAAKFWPMEVEGITPEQLASWLDDAGIRNRVVSISACYSGGWIEPLANEHTLVMTAADADNTSYGCGRLSELTFFGRAVFDEQLRTHTRSFEQAHATARPLIEQREQEAGKEDGYSNPQLSAGAAIRARLQQLQSRLEHE